MKVAAVSKCLRLRLAVMPALMCLNKSQKQPGRRCLKPLPTPLSRFTPRFRLSFRSLRYALSLTDRAAASPQPSHARPDRGGGAAGSMVAGSNRIGVVGDHGGGAGNLARCAPEL